MKATFLLLALVFSSLYSLSLRAGNGGISGGNSVDYTTFYVCDGGESGQECRTVRIKNKNLPDSSSTQSNSPDCLMIGNGEQMIPCGPEQQYDIPTFLEKLNNLFKEKKSQDDPSQDDPYVN